jgi:hypothetical protein
VRILQIDAKWSTPLRELAVNSEGIRSITAQNLSFGAYCALRHPIHYAHFRKRVSYCASLLTIAIQHAYRCGVREALVLLTLFPATPMGWHHSELESSISGGIS